MFHLRYTQAALALLVGLLLTACNRSSNASDAPSGTTLAAAKYKPGATWQPKWDTAADKGKKEKSVLSPTVSFVDQGFHGSPMPKNEIEKEQERPLPSLSKRSPSVSA